MRVDIGFQPTLKPNTVSSTHKPPAPKIAPSTVGGQFHEFPDLWVQETLRSGWCLLMGSDGQPHRYLVDSHSWPSLLDGTIEGLHITLSYDWSQNA